jgi:hypothetical protein
LCLVSLTKQKKSLVAYSKKLGEYTTYINTADWK